MKKIRVIVLGILIALMMSTCGQQPGISPTGEDSGASSIPKEYPEFTLEAQDQAMRQLEEMRKAARVDGLREKIPPADWIAGAYHGLIFDANYDVIPMDFETVSRMQESLFTTLYDPIAETANKKYGTDLKQIFFDAKMEDKDRLVVRTSVLMGLLDLSDPKIQDQYIWRHDLIRGGADALVNWEQYVIPPHVRELLIQAGLVVTLYPASSEYVRSCREQEVPIPPNWPDDRWQHQGQLNLVFLTGAGSTTDVYTYTDPNVPGVCYALPRRREGVITLLGIICQSDTTGKACFWDNKTPSNVPLEFPPTTRLVINEIADGSNLRENCTFCHRGYNAFLIHPGTALDLGRSDAVGGPYPPSHDTAPAVRYAPVGQATWRNPDPLTLPSPPNDRDSCKFCHEIPGISGLPPSEGNYCRSVLPMAARSNMPASRRPGVPPTPAGWPPDPVDPLYADDINFLYNACR